MRTVHRDIVSGLIISKDGKLLMGRKNPHHGGVYADCWHLPGGGIDAYESPLQALTREIQEEVGLDVTKYQIALVDNLGRGESVKTVKESGERILCKMKFTVYRIEIPEDTVDILVKPGDDLVELNWIDLAHIKDYQLTPPSIALFTRLGYSRP